MKKTFTDYTPNISGALFIVRFLIELFNINYSMKNEKVVLFFSSITMFLLRFLNYARLSLYDINICTLRS